MSAIYALPGNEEMADRLAWLPRPAPAARLRVNVLNTGDDVVCEVDEASNTMTSTVEFVYPAPRRLGDLLPAGAPQLRIDGVPVSLVSAGNPHVFVDAAEVPRGVPVLGIDGFTGAVGTAPIGSEHLRAPELDLAVRGDAQFDAAHGVADAAQPREPGLFERGAHAGLGGTIDLVQGQPEACEELQHGARCGRRTRAQRPGLREA